MEKTVLVVLSARGYWGEELIGPLEALDGARSETEFVTSKGTKTKVTTGRKLSDALKSGLRRYGW